MAEKERIHGIAACVIHLGNRPNPVAVAITDGKIVAVGPKSELGSVMLARSE
jgi:predicted amidohydrolase YtcJ